MAKKVRYNGGTQSYYGCSDPTNLVVGKEYEVVLSRDRGWQTLIKHQVNRVSTGILPIFSQGESGNLAVSCKNALQIIHARQDKNQESNGCHTADFKGGHHD